jgi:hypothetical protein
MYCGEVVFCGSLKILVEEQSMEALKASIDSIDSTKIFREPILYC